jgi:putative transposase
MPWKNESIVGERRRLIKLLLRGDKSLRYWCGVFGISRKTAWKWKQRFLEAGRGGLRDRSRQPRRMPRRLSALWIRRLKRLRQKEPYWGPKKARAWFIRQGWQPPAVRTIARWHQRLGWSHSPLRRPRRVYVRRRSKLTQPCQANQVWTVDFKGWFRAGNGERCEPLTVRDLFSRYGLLARVLATQHGPPVQAAFTGLFKRHGLPEVIRVDNGSPFASKGPAGLSRLSAWWVRLGIRVEFTRPGCPQDNGAHEQFHRVLKRETAGPAVWTRQGQQHRTTVWLRHYNQLRPHESLGQLVPARRYRKSQRKFSKRLPELKYGPSWLARRVRSNGEIRWAGGRRFIGEAFVGQPVGLRSLRQGVQAVYFTHILIGHLHEREAGAMRPVRYEHRFRLPKKSKM